MTLIWELGFRIPAPVSAAVHSLSRLAVNGADQSGAIWIKSIIHKTPITFIFFSTTNTLKNNNNKIK